MVHDQDVAVWEAHCREGGTVALLSLHCLGGEEKFAVNMFSSSALPGGGRVTDGKSKNVEIHLWSSLLSAMAESEEELKSVLMKVKEDSGKNWLKVQHSENEDHGIRSHHFMGNRWGNSGNSVRLYFFGLQNHCRW